MEELLVWTLGDYVRKSFYSEYNKTTDKLDYCVSLSDVMLNLDYVRSLYKKGFSVTGWNITGIISIETNPALIKLATYRLRDSVGIKLALDKEHFKIKKSPCDKIWRKI